MANKNNDQLGLSRAKAAVPLRTVRGSLTETYMALAPRSPSRRSLRVASESQYAHDPYPLAPLLADELPPPPTIHSRVFKFVIHLSQLSFAEAFAPLCALPGAGVSGICVVLQFGDCCLVSAVLGLVFLSSTQDPCSSSGGGERVPLDYRNSRHKEHQHGSSIYRLNRVQGRAGL